MSALRIEHSTYGNGSTTAWVSAGGVELGGVTSHPLDGLVAVLPAERSFRVADEAAGVRLLAQLDAVAACGGDVAAALAALAALAGTEAR